MSHKLAPERGATRRDTRTDYSRRCVRRSEATASGQPNAIDFQFVPLLFISVPSGPHHSQTPHVGVFEDPKQQRAISQTRSVFRSLPFIFGSGASLDDGFESGFEQ